MSSSAAVSQPPLATFTATSNDVSATNVSNGSLSRLKPIIESNKAFVAAAKPKIIQSSIGQDGETKSFVGVISGFVSTVVQAYNTHHNLIIRPDDVWQAIVTQFSFYVNGNAEALRDKLVDFQGKKQLVVSAGGTLFSADYAGLATSMVGQIAKNIKDPSVAEWIMPNFTTTQTTDKVVASVSLMSAMQKFFDYKFCLCCGIPQVTLLGTVEDWQQLRAKVDKLEEFNLKSNEMNTWARLLRTITDEFVLSAQGKPNREFWDRVCCHFGGGSGPSYLSGWITTFAVFNEEGKWQAKFKVSSFGSQPDDFFCEESQQPKKESKPKDRFHREPQTLLYPAIDSADLPIGIVTVPVLVDDNGVEYDTVMTAGQFAFNVIGGNTLQCRSDWCISYDGKPKQN